MKNFRNYLLPLGLYFLISGIYKYLWHNSDQSVYLGIFGLVIIIIAIVMIIKVKRNR